MRKSIKWIGAIISILVLLAILTVISLATFVNPNRFKPMIAGQVMKYTGRQLTIEGDLSWSFFPCLGVKTGHLVLSNPPGFEQKIFAEIQHATIGVKLFPLLQRRIELNGVMLDGLKLNLIKDANGKNNWQFQPVSTTTAPALTDRSHDNLMKPLSLGLVVSNIDISNAEINWIDQQKKQSASIEKFNLQAKNINLSKPFSINSDFNFINQKPILSGHVKLMSNIVLNVEEQIFSFHNVSLNSQIQQGMKKINWQMKGDLIADLKQQTLQWTHFSEQLGPMSLIGQVRVIDLMKNPNATGHIEIQPFDLKELLQDFNYDVTNIQALNNVQGYIDFTGSAHTMDVQGKFTVGTAVVKQVKLNHAVIPLHYQIGILELSPITADFYQGSLRSDTKINLTGAVPQIATQSKLSNVRIESLLQDLGGNKQKLKIAGVGNIELQLTTMGTNSDAMLKNLNGTGNINCNQGILQGLDIGYLIDSAYAMLKQKVLTTPDTKQTTFNSLTGNMVFRDGVMLNDNLVLTSPRFQTNGKGTIDLVNQKMDYHLQTLVNQSDLNQANDLKNLYGLPIPINITGNLMDPAIRLDTAVLAKALADQQIKKVEQKVQDKINEKIQGKEIQGKAKELLQNLLN